MTNAVTNLIVLSLTIVTNIVPGKNEFRQMGNSIVGIKSIEFAEQRGSFGYRQGTNAIELFTMQRILWAKTNWHELPLVTGVLQSTPETVKPAPEPPKHGRLTLEVD